MPRILTQGSSPESAAIRASVRSRIDHDAGIASVLDNFCKITHGQPPIAFPADDHDWPETGCDLQWVDGLDGFPDDRLVRPIKPNRDAPPGGAISVDRPRCRIAHVGIDRHPAASLGFRTAPRHNGIGRLLKRVSDWPIRPPCFGEDRSNAKGLLRVQGGHPRSDDLNQTALCGWPFMLRFSRIA
jgi:hypothetical protein